MSTLLHSPIRDPATLAAIVRRNDRETAQLEFKAIFWARSAGADDRDHIREAAKDVAALANGLGGDILVGVASRDSRAVGYSPWCPQGSEDRSRESLRDWLREYLQPASFKDHVEAILVAAPADVACGHVLVVTVPPSEGLVAAVVNPDDNSVRFPIRSDDGTRWANVEEAMARFSLATRAMFLKLTPLLIGDETRVRIVSRFEALLSTQHGDVTGRMPVSPRSLYHGVAGALRETGFTFAPAGLNYSRGGSNASVPAGMEIPIPLDLVRTAWRVGDVVHIALLAPLVSHQGIVTFEVA